MKRVASGGTVSDQCSQRKSRNARPIGSAPDLNGSGIRIKFLPRRVGWITHYLWYAVYHEGEVLNAYATKRREHHAALKLLRKTVKPHGNHVVIVTDRLRSYRAALKVVGNEGKKDVGRWLNNRAENSHQPLKRHVRAMLFFTRMLGLTRFIAVHSSVHNHFNLEHPITDRNWLKENRKIALPSGRSLPPKFANP